MNGPPSAGHCSPLPPLTVVEVDGLQVAYRTAGTGPDVVLLHGFLSDSRAWAPQITRSL